MSSSSRQKRNRKEGEEGDTATNPIELVNDDVATNITGDDSNDTSIFCNPQLRDPLSVAMGFMTRPAIFRRCCQFTVEVWEQAVYLEGFLPCSYAYAQGGGGGDNNSEEDGGGRSSSGRPMPINHKRLNPNRGKVSPTRRNEQQLHQPQYPHLYAPHLYGGVAAGGGGMAGRPHSAVAGKKKERIPRNAEDMLHTVVISGLATRWISVDLFGDQCPFKQVCFRDLPELGEVGGDVLKGAFDLESVSLKDLPKLELLGAHFCDGCVSLRSATLGEGGDGGGGENDEERETTPLRRHSLPKLTNIGVGFLQGCSALESFTLSHLPGLDTIEANFLYNCTSLRSLIMERLPKLKEIKGSFMLKCTLLENLIFKGFHNLQTIGASFLRGCTSLTCVVFEDLPVLASLGHRVFSHCDSLREITLGGLPRIKTVGNEFLYHCLNLKTAKFGDLPECESVGEGWLSDCPVLETLTFFGAIPNLEIIGERFLRLSHRMTRTAAAAAAAAGGGTAPLEPTAPTPAMVLLKVRIPSADSCNGAVGAAVEEVTGRNLELSRV